MAGLINRWMPMSYVMSASEKEGKLGTAFSEDPRTEDLASNLTLRYLPYLPKLLRYMQVLVLVHYVVR